MSASLDQQTALLHIRKRVDTFEIGETRDQKSPYFAEGELESLARRLGALFWLPTKRAYTIFLYAYSALFGIPAFVSEALARIPDRFSKKRLPLTIRTTSSFILDGFGYDRRVERQRDVVYAPAPAIRSAHSGAKGKRRISNPAMAYFGYHLIRAAETFAPDSKASDCKQHYSYFGDFFRTAGYPFPKDRRQAEAFVRDADRDLAGSDYADLWHNIFHAAEALDTVLDPESLAEFLPSRTSRLFTVTMAINKS